MKHGDFSILAQQRLRPDMQDAHSICADFEGKPGIFVGVYDGHGQEGARPATMAAERLPGLFLNLLGNVTPAEAFKKAYKLVHDEMVWARDSGTCAATVYIKNGILYHANAGDCGIIIAGNTLTTLSTDHRVNNTEERERILRHGGLIHQGKHVAVDEYGLMVTRTLGDRRFSHAGVIAEPTVGSYEIRPTDRFLIIGSDGLFDNLSDQKILDAAAEAKTAAGVTFRLNRMLLRKGNGDNLTVIVLKL